jgi:hypothetical protein
VKTSFLCLLAMGAAIAAAADDGGLEQTAARQEQIRGDAQSLVARLDDVIADYTRNGIANGEDFEALKAVREALGTLSDDEMEQVVEILRGADGDRGQMAKAYAGQKDISVRLKQILAEHELDQDLDALASGVRQLADRQSANLNAAIDTRQLAAQDQSENGQAAVTASEEAQQSEQSAIADEVKLIADKLGKIATDSKGQEAAAELVRVEPEADDAATALGAGKIDDAEPLEKTAREQLEEVARALMPVGAPEPAPSRATGDLSALARQEHLLLAQTTKLNTDLKRIADAGNAAGAKSKQEALQSQFAGLVAVQAALVEKAQLAEDDLQKAANTAAVPIATVLPQMAAAQQALAASDGEQAARDEAESASQLDQAQHLAQQIAAATQPGSLEQQLRQLQTGLNSLAARETASVQQGDALKAGATAVPATEAQQNMADKAAALGQAAAAIGSGAAQPLGQAEDAFRKAAQLMSAGGAAMDAEAAQQSALQKLGEVGQQLAQEMARIGTQKQYLTAMDRQMAGIGRLIQQQRQLGIDAERGGAAKDKLFAREQAALQKNAESLRKALNNIPPDAGAALAQADAAMNDAAQSLTGGAGDQARPRQQDALSALYQAQDALAGLMQVAPQGLGQSLAQERSQAAAALGKAQADAAAARNAMASGGLGANPMRDAVQKLGIAASQPQALPQTARDDLRAAVQAAAESAAAAAGEASRAQAEAQQASQAMDAAQSALGQEAAGIAAAPEESPPAQQLSGGGLPGNGEQSSTTAQSNNSAQPGMNPPEKGGSGASEKGWSDQAGTAKAGTSGTTGAGRFQGLPARDRAALEQSQSEKYPQEYGSMVEQYMRNLAGDNSQ